MDLVISECGRRQLAVVPTDIAVPVGVFELLHIPLAEKLQESATHDQSGSPNSQISIIAQFVRGLGGLSPLDRIGGTGLSGQRIISYRSSVVELIT